MMKINLSKLLNYILDCFSEKKMKLIMKNITKRKNNVTKEKYITQIFFRMLKHKTGNTFY